MNNKTKIFLLLTFGFVFLSAQNSFAAAYDDYYLNRERPCFETTGDLAGSIDSDELCIIRPIPGKLSFAGDSCSISSIAGVQLDWIKVGFGPDGENAIRVKSVLTSSNAIDWSYFGNLRPNYGCSRVCFDPDTGGGSVCIHPSASECDLKPDAYPCITPCLSTAQIYINAKTAIIRSCLPGYITATRKGNISCSVLPCKNKLMGGCLRYSQNLFLDMSNYPDSPIEGCGPLIDSIFLWTNIEPTASLIGDQAYRNGRIEVRNSPKDFILKWKLSNPGATCEISGIWATRPTKQSDGTPNEFSASINNENFEGDVLVNGMTGVVTPFEKSQPFSGAVDGVYTYTMNCGGVLNGKESSKRGSVTAEPVKVYVGDIPPDPTVREFSIVTENNEDLKFIPASTNANTGVVTPEYYTIPKNKSFQLKWSVENAGNTTTTATGPEANKAPAKPIKILRSKIGLASKPNENSYTAINNISNPQTIEFSSTDNTGTYIFWLEASGPFGLKTSSYPDRDTLAPCNTTNNKCIRIRALSAGRPDVPVGDFTADKTQIAKGESVVLTWDIVGASSISINHGIGIVQENGTTTVSPTTATTYTLTAKSPVATTPDITKSVTITIKSSELVVKEITDFVPPEEIKMEKQEGAPTEKVTDLKVNAVDGPITLNAPATFSLSWNLDHYCLSTGSWLSIKTKAGAESITLNKNGKYTYSLYCPGYGTDSVEVNIVNGSNNGLLGNNGLLSGLGIGGGKAVSMPFAEASASTDLINYSQNIKVIRGEPTDIYIKVDQDINNDGKITRDASGLWSELLSFGGYCLYNNNLIQGTPKFDGMVKDPETSDACNTKLGTFTFNDKPGTYKYGIFKLLQSDDKFSNISYINIIVENIPSPETAPVIDLKINGNDATEQILGTPANFNVFWDVINATSCEASGSWSGSKSLSGLQNFISSSKKDFVYTLTCIGQLGTTAKSITLRVVEAPICSFTALPPSLNKTSAFVTESELSWKCDYTDECSLSPNATNAKIKTYGSLRVSPAQTTNYILTCNNSDVFKSFEAKVDIIN